jgi:hypothetical protein
VAQALLSARRQAAQRRSPGGSSGVLVGCGGRRGRAEKHPVEAPPLIKRAPTGLIGNDNDRWSLVRGDGFIETAPRRRLLRRSGHLVLRRAAKGRPGVPFCGTAPPRGAFAV